MIRRHPLLSVVTLVYLAVVAVITLSPQPLDAPPNALLQAIVTGLHVFAPTSWVTYDQAEFTANIVLFVPLGVLFTLALGSRRWWIVLLIGVGSTCLIETAQLFIPGRFSDVRDLIANTLGTLVGIGITAAAMAVHGSRTVRE